MSGRRGALALLLATGCNGAPGGAHVSEEPPHSAPAAAPQSSLTGSEEAGHASPWAELVRSGSWDEAWQALQSLPEADRSRPEVRYVRGRVAQSRDDSSSALAVYTGLENDLPLLAEDIARRRAEAKLHIGPFEEAGEWYSAKGTPAALIEAGQAFAKVKDWGRVRAVIDRLLANGRRTRIEEARGRAVRAVVPGDEGASRGDLRWLAVDGADVRVGFDAMSDLSRLDPDHPLTARELMVRAQTLADGGRLDEALQSLDLSKTAPRSGEVSVLERSRLRAMALYHAGGHASEAARLLAECARAGGSHSAEDAFYAARALSRADRDEEAIVAYEKAAARYADSPWGAKAAFFPPYLRMLHGDWTVCARGFGKLLGGRILPDQAEDARRDGALCSLMSGDFKAARRAFEHLADDDRDLASHSRMANMAALAALRDGDRTHAVARWLDVVRSSPLTWPALIARARLAEAGVSLPPQMEEDAPPTSDPAPLTVRLPPPADLLHAVGLDADAEAALREREAVFTAGESRVSELLCRAYGEIGRAHRRYQISQSLSASLLGTKPGPATRWAWECAFPAPYQDIVRSVESSEGLPVGLLWAVMRQESAFDPDAVSTARAVGLMQILPEVARPIASELNLPEDEARLHSPKVATMIAARLLGKLLTRFQGQVPLAIAAYNAGTESVVRWLSRAPGMDLDTFVERIPFAETRQYVVKVMGNLARYGYLYGGEADVPRVTLGLEDVRRPWSN